MLITAVSSQYAASIKGIGSTEDTAIADSKK